MHKDDKLPTLKINTEETRIEQRKMIERQTTWQTIYEEDHNTYNLEEPFYVYVYGGMQTMKNC